MLDGSTAGCPSPPAGGRIDRHHPVVPMGPQTTLVRSPRDQGHLPDRTRSGRVIDGPQETVQLRHARPDIGGITLSHSTSGEIFHSKPGESLADPYNIPGILLFFAGVVGLASTLTAAGYGFGGWTALGAAATALCFVTSVTVFVLEHERLRRLARRH